MQQQLDIIYLYLQFIPKISQNLIRISEYYLLYNIEDITFEIFDIVNKY